jgi:multidrug efflux pump subunit AcrA (membrane-fusion protein)
VKLTPQGRQNLKLEVGPLTPQPYWRTLMVPGVVVERPGESDRSVPARIGGIVTRIDAKPGDSISPGQTLFVIEPTGEVVRTQVELANAVKELAILTANRDVVAAQVKEKTRPANDLIDPQKQVDLASNKVDGLRKQLQALKLTDAQVERAAKGQPVEAVEVVAPEPADTGGSAGGDPPEFDVHELNVRLGDTVQPGQALCVLSSHRRLLVEGQAFESETAALADLMARRVGVRAEFAGERPGEWAAPPPLLIDRLSHTVNPATRTFPFYLSLENQRRTAGKDAESHHWRFRPGQRVRLQVPVEKLGDAVLVLPAGAVVREGAEAYAFVQNGDLFVRKAVTVLYEDREAVVLANDGSLPGGAFVVKNQAAALNRAVKAASEGGGGGHEHDHEH